MTWLVYILECGDKSLYTGITKDMNHRLRRHKDGTGAKYTRGRGPFVVKYKQKVRSRSEAVKREAEIKRLNRAEKNDLINEFFSLNRPTNN